MIKKNDILELEIIDINDNLDGVAKFNDFTIFVEKTIPKDIVKAKIYKIKKNYAIAKLVKIIKISELSVIPSNKYKNIECSNTFCRMQYKYQLEYKLKKVKKTIKNIAKLDENIVKPIISADEKEINRYRNKAIYPASMNGKLLDFGYFKPKSHNVIFNKDSILENEQNVKILCEISDFCNKYKILPYNENSHKGILRNVMIRTNYNNEIMLVLIINANKFPFEKEFINFIKEKFLICSIVININKKRTNVVLSDKSYPIYKKDEIIDKIGDYKFYISCNSFFQVNKFMTKKLYDLALKLSNVSKNDIIWDLYSGVSSIGIYFSNYVKKVYSLEIVKSAVENGKKNAIINNINNIEFEEGDVLKNIINWKNKEKPNIIIVDPPRNGLEKKVIDEILKIQPNKILYISCKVSTLARDIALFTTNNNYKVETIIPVDMFPHTMHVESVVLMSRVAPTK